MSYTHTTTVPMPYTQAVEATRAALAEQGFGILTEIDVKATFTKKLGAESGEAVGDYIILGACNPTLASKALAAEPELGALLPCNVVVRRGATEDHATIDAIDPQTMVQLSDSAAVREVAEDAEQRLRAALDAISAAAKD
ncbi:MULTISPECIES: DUF302 domain-containing protein [unclassified Nesterenkonia]|uniref:DUF302 domain-containing protein n=1 Tax=unclassified Nesterenkonia TaxID=2629769 RepID=UPI001F4C993D|nr:MULTISPECIES: DUF302 domain-containing protein [unclassified Nesterenkonia]MCH8559183.1 DUF302 domain-containing protein [Nesterenkonia sp. DZ6]MCH8563096.1 DUF302 domain-containing protein [Nesterenkonia sp. YGD6]MCH8571530.1 DUF302 domain-containing protein [Nesterenkonia sp. AY15]